MIALNAHVDWEAFRADLNRVHLGAGVHSGERKSNAGAKPIDVVLYNVSQHLADDCNCLIFKQLLEVPLSLIASLAYRLPAVIDL